MTQAEGSFGQSRVGGGKEWGQGLGWGGGMEIFG